jgi:hypothetical protein
MLPVAAKDAIIDNIIAKLHLYGKNREVDFDNLQIFIHISDGKQYSNILWDNKKFQPVPTSPVELNSR